MASSSSGVRYVHEDEADWQVHRWMEKQLRESHEPWFRNTRRSGLYALMQQEEGGGERAAEEPVQEEKRAEESVSQPPVDKSKPVTLKVVVIGDAGAGKTSLVNQYVNRKFSDTLPPSRSGGFFAKEVNIDDRIVTLQVISCHALPSLQCLFLSLKSRFLSQIWDTLGEERHSQLSSEYYRDADSCVLVFDVNVAKSFENLESWRNEFLQQVGMGKTFQREETRLTRKRETISEWFPYVGPVEGREDEFHSFPFVVVGNKVDREERVVPQKKALAWTQGKGDIPFFECSAKDTLNVDKAFECVARSALAFADWKEEHGGESDEEESPAEEVTGNKTPLGWLFQQLQSSLAKK